MKKTSIECSVQVMKVSDLAPASYNARKISKKARKALETSMRKFGCVELPIWNKRTKCLVGGHQRVEIMADAGVLKIPVIVVDLDESMEKAANLSLNNKALMGEFTDPIIELLSEMEKEDAALFQLLRADHLKNKLDKTEKQGVPENSKSDTKCPFCNHEWCIAPEDVFLVDVVGGEEKPSEKPTEQKNPAT